MMFKYFFSKSKMEVFFLKDCVHGFQGEIKSVKPGFAQKYLIPQTIAYQNLPGFRSRLLPKIDESQLQSKIKRRAQVAQFQSKIQGIFLEFVKAPKFSNPNQIKEPIDDDQIVEELNSRYRLNITKKNITLGNKINTYGQTPLTIDDFYSEELGEYTTFQIQVITKKPAAKVAKLFDDGEVPKEEEKGKEDEKEPNQEADGKAAPLAADKK